MIRRLVALAGGVRGDGVCVREKSDMDGPIARLARSLRRRLSRRTDRIPRFPLPDKFAELGELPSLPNRGLAPDHPDFERIQALQAEYDKWAAMVFEKEIVPRGRADARRVDA